MALKKLLQPTLPNKSQSQLLSHPMRIFPNKLKTGKTSKVQK
tara:strand:- start:488 stop:613 length:126 start_codon:yes stop_codon:yes gene_type:complete